MFDQVKLAVGAILLSAILGLGLLVNHYHSLYVDLTAELAVKGLESKSFQEAAKSCSDSVSDFQKQALNKALEVDVAQKKVSVLAKKNESLAQQLLQAEPSVPNNSCESAVKMFQQYKNSAIITDQ